MPTTDETFSTRDAGPPIRRGELHRTRGADTATTDHSRTAVAEGGPCPPWTSETAFASSAAAAGVGLGNPWRFPYRAGVNGGGAFIVAQGVAVPIAAAPFAALEVAAGASPPPGSACSATAWWWWAGAWCC